MTLTLQIVLTDVLRIIAGNTKDYQWIQLQLSGEGGRSR